MRREEIKRRHTCGNFTCARQITVPAQEQKMPLHKIGTAILTRKIGSRTNRLPASLPLYFYLFEIKRITTCECLPSSFLSYLLYPSPSILLSFLPSHCSRNSFFPTLLFPTLLFPTSFSYSSLFYRLFFLLLIILAFHYYVSFLFFR